MQAEEYGHRRRLRSCFQQFGDHIPLIRRRTSRLRPPRPVWLTARWGSDRSGTWPRHGAGDAAVLTRRSAVGCLRLATEVLVSAGRRGGAGACHLPSAGAGRRRHAETEEDEAHRRLFVLQVVQPGLAGLMDGSVSTLAPVFAAAFATCEGAATAHSWSGCRQHRGGISIGLSEALRRRFHDRPGKPLIRGSSAG